MCIFKLYYIYMHTYMIIYVTWMLQIMVNVCECVVPLFKYGVLQILDRCQASLEPNWSQPPIHLLLWSEVSATPGCMCPAQALT